MENKTGKGWLELAKSGEFTEHPLSEQEIFDTTKEAFENRPISDKEYFDNIMQDWSPAGRELFDKLLREEADRFLEEQKKYKHKYFKNRFK